MSSSGYVGFTLRFTATIIIPKLNQIVFAIGHLTRDVDLVAVGVVGLSAVFAVFVGPVVYLCQVFVAVRSGIDISISAVRVSFLQEAAAFPNESVFSSRPSEN